MNRLGFVGLRVVLGPREAVQDPSLRGVIGTIIRVEKANGRDEVLNVYVVWDVPISRGDRSKVHAFPKLPDGSFNLRVYDNAQLEVLHRQSCSCCEQPIKGIRYTCVTCTQIESETCVNLCFHCYHADNHGVTHQFALTICRGEAQRKLPESRAHAQTRRVHTAKGMFATAQVQRGRHWLKDRYGNQDGGEGCLGEVLRLVDIGPKGRAGVLIRWAKGMVNPYRYGAHGCLDVQIVKQARGDGFYPDHLPIVGIWIPEFRASAAPMLPPVVSNVPHAVPEPDPALVNAAFASDARIVLRRSSESPEQEDGPDIGYDPYYEWDRQDQEQTDAYQGSRSSDHGVMVSGDYGRSGSGEFLQYNAASLAALQDLQISEVGSTRRERAVLPPRRRTDEPYEAPLPSVEEQFKACFTPSTNDIATALSLIDRYPAKNLADMNLTGDGIKALHLGVRSNSSTFVRELLLRGADVMQLTSENCSALHVACYADRQYMVQFLLEKGADPNFANIFGRTPLSIAADRGHVRCIEALCQSEELDVNVPDAFLGDKCAAEILILHGQDWLRDDGRLGDTTGMFRHIVRHPSFAAVRQGSYLTKRAIENNLPLAVRMLLETYPQLQGMALPASPDMPLHYAVRSDQRNIVRMLMDEELLNNTYRNPLILNRNDQSVLRLSLRYSNPSLFDHILEKALETRLPLRDNIDSPIVHEAVEVVRDIGLQVDSVVVAYILQELNDVTVTAEQLASVCHNAALAKGMRGILVNMPHDIDWIENQHLDPSVAVLLRKCCQLANPNHVPSAPEVIRTDGACTRCRQERANVQFLPCSHEVFCSNCYNSGSVVATCPLCNTVIRGLHVSRAPDQPVEAPVSPAPSVSSAQSQSAHSTPPQASVAAARAEDIDRLKCPICYENDKDHSLDCGHVYCLPCLKKYLGVGGWFNNDRSQWVCPHCREPIRNDPRKVYL